MSVHAYRARRAVFLAVQRWRRCLPLARWRAHRISRRKVSPRKINPCSLSRQPQTPALHRHRRQHRTVGGCACNGGARTPARVGGGAGQLPQITVTAPPVRRSPRQVVRRAPPPPTVPPVTPAEQLTEKQNGFDAARSNLYTTIGTTSDTISNDTIQALPQGTNAAVERFSCRRRVCRRIPPPAGSFHVRNDHANVQFRINGVMLPDGVTGFGSVLDTDLIGSISLITGALPAEYGLRTTGLSTSPPAPTFSIIRAVSVITAAAAAPSSRVSNMAAPNCPSTRHRDGKTGSRRRGLFWRRAIFPHRQLPADHRGHRKSAADAQCHPRFLVAGKRLRLRLDFHRPLYAPDPDGGNGHQQFPDSQRAGCADPRSRE